MSVAHAWTVALFGIDGVPMKIEAQTSTDQLGAWRTDWSDAWSEARERVRAAVRNSNLPWPTEHVTLALIPETGSLPGPAADLAIAVAVLAAAGLVPPQRLERTVLLGELALDGRVRAGRGVLPALLSARHGGMRRAVVPASSLPEAGLVSGIQVLGAERLSDVAEWLRGERDLPTGAGRQLAPADSDPADLADVVGQAEAAWALEIAAAGGHPLLFIGRPGTGMSMLARRLPGLLPALTLEQALEVTAIHSIAGGLAPEAPLITTPPFVAPHHSISTPALIGGGVGLAKPGAISKAHHGVLFVDAAAEFGPAKLDAVRTALKDGEVRLARRAGIARYPCRFHLVLTNDSCPCRALREQDCSCSPVAKRRYLSRLSGPLLDRIDLRVRMRPADPTGGGVPAASTAVVRGRVEQARQRAANRWAGHGWLTNAEVPGHALRRDFALPRSVTNLLDRSLASGAITTRGADRCLRVAWTLADLADLDRPTADQIAEALVWRDRRTS